MAKECVLCKERDSELKRILTAYKKDKLLYRKIILVEGVIMLFLAAFGADGLRIVSDIIKGFIK